MRAIGLIKDTIFPRFCCGCGAEGELICSRCVEGVASPQDNSCLLCGAKTSRTHLCYGCRKESGLSDLIAIGEFKGALRELLHALKYEDVRDGARDLAKLLARQLQPLPHPMWKWQKGVIVPVPLHVNRRRERGYNQSELIASALADVMEWTYLPALIKVKNTKRQTELTRTDRLDNMAGAFRSHYNLSGYGKPVYLVDDVLTTGATLSAAAQALKKAGARQVVGVVVATGR